jgi:hypothetical protein
MADGREMFYTPEALMAQGALGKSGKATAVRQQLLDITMVRR